jgi:amino acid transporter
MERIVLTPVRKTGNSVESHLPQVVVVTTAMLTFISFWRAAAIVLNDLASSAYYAGGIAEQAMGKTAPWFILAVMLLSYAVRSVYIESCGMFVRGGVYRVVKEAMGGTMAKISVSALLFDYVLTGPISGVSAGQYLVGFLNELFRYARLDVHLSRDFAAACFAALVTLYFWWVNIKGIPESSEKALRIMYVTTAMVVLLISWCTYTSWVRGVRLPPWPLPQNLHFSPEALGWLRGARLPTIGVLGIFIGLGHSVLAMSGEETLAQVYREIEYPKLHNLKKAALVIFIYSLVFTSLVSFFAVMIIPDQIRPAFFDNLIGGLTMYVAGPHSLKLAFHLFVALVGVLILSGAVNTSMVGSNGVLNRVSEDGVLPDWFRHPHSRFGTAYRIINVVAVLQLLAIVFSRGNLYVLGEAYAFGVLWSFVLKSLGVLVLRFKRPGAREFRVPLNFRFHGTEIPLGLGSITLALLAIATTNLLTKPVATISGISFSAFLFVVFTASERFTQKHSLLRTRGDQFQLTPQPDLSPAAVGCRPGGLLVGVGNYHALWHLGFVLRQANVERQDVVVLHIRVIRRASSGEHELAPDQLFTAIEQVLFTKVVALAEKEGKQVRLAVVEVNNLWDGIVRAAASLQSSTVVLGKSSKVSINQQARLIGLAWERLPQPRPMMALEIYSHSGEKHFFYLGPHVPHLTPREIELIHKVWLELNRKLNGRELHHHDVVYFALKEMEREIAEGKDDMVIHRLRRYLLERDNRPNY